MSDTRRSPFITNEHGTWCPSCGELLSRETEFDPDGECPTCGFPDDIEMMAQFHCDDGQPDEMQEWRDYDPDC